MADGNDLELARPPPAAPATLGVARSLADARDGQIVVVNRRGEVIGRERLMARAYLHAAIRLSGLGLVWGALLYAGHPFLALGVCGASFAYSLTRLGRNQELRAAMALLASRRYDDAFVAFEKIDQRRLAPASRAFVALKLAVLDWIRGNRERALERYDRVLDRVRGRRRHRATYWFATLERAALLPTLGRLDEARATERDLDAAPDGELFTFMRQNVSLAIAFHADDAGGLPDDLALHDWARAALGRTRFGVTLVRLAWAFARRGDVGMAQHLLAESSSRLDYPVANADPALGRWMEERMTEWAITPVAREP